jgi:DNA-nicking Smr family endonuclease
MPKPDRHGQSKLSDWHLWADVARTVTPLHPGVPEPFVLDEPVKPQAKTQVALPRDWTIGSAAAGTSAAFPPPGKPKPAERGIEPNVRRKVTRGRISLDGTIDLHGLRQDEARAALARFLQARARRGDRTVLVITGKGLQSPDPAALVERGVLRTMLPFWLNGPELAPLIAGWSQAAQHHGGGGAYYVRLKRGAP